MSTASATLWLGRVTTPDSPRQHVVRIRTAGGSPGPTDAVEEIADPFEACNTRWSGDAQGADPAALAGEADAVAGGLAGPLGQFALAPPVRPGKILCVGRNYRAHAEEMGNEVPSTPLIFFKPSSALLPSGAAIELPPLDHQIDYEGELVVVIGRAARGVRAADAWDHVAGYALGNDVSNRVLQRQDKQWTRAKGFDTFAPLGPFVRLGHALDPGVRIQTFVGDDLRQDGPVSAMIFDIPAVIEHLSACMTLEPGDLIYTGTPSGVGPLSVGNVVRVEAVGLDLGRLTNTVVAAAD